ncbi:hypothetical protein FRB95_012138 [Tulasnella sp. JGI-2019a]|nr:hypothetical protein FRB95_012138 [Tulasnella sp. JGI-2019a]
MPSSSNVPHDVSKPRSAAHDVNTARVARHLPHQMRTTVFRVVSWATFCLATGILPVLALSSLMPFLNMVTIPLFAGLALCLFYLMPCLAYLTLSQTDPPEHVRLPFLPAPWDWKLCLQVNLLVFKWIRVAFRVIPPVVVDWCVMRVVEAKDVNDPRRMTRRDVSYDNTQPTKRLDVYRAQPRQREGKNDSDQVSLAFAIRQVAQSMTSDSDEFITPVYTNRDLRTLVERPVTLAPIIIFIPSPHLGPLTQSKWMYESLGRNLASLGYTVVIPNVTRYPDGRTRDMVGDVRKVMRWTERHAAEWSGDPNRIWLAGHSLGAHLALLTVLQEAVVDSRENFLAQYGDDGQMSNGLRKLRVYEPEVEIPQVAGLILLSPVCDVNEQIVSEASRGAAHLSKLRRILGPTHKTAMFHSPAHILHASRNVVDPGLLPPKVLFIHGGLDEEVHHSQSEMMKEMMRGVGVLDAKCRVYPIGHVDVMTALMTGLEDPFSEQILEELTSFTAS